MPKVASLPSLPAIPDVVVKKLPVTLGALTLAYFLFSSSKSKEVPENDGMNSETAAILHALGPYRKLDPKEYTKVMDAVLKMNKFLATTSVNSGTAQAFSYYAGDCIEAMRSYRYCIHKKYPYLEEEFDEVATDFQNFINTLSTNILLDSQSAIWN